MERMLVAAAPYWQETGWQADIIAQGSDHPYAKRLMSAGYHVDYIRSLRTAAGLGDLARLLRKARPDVVHIHTEGAHGPVSLVARITLPRAGLVHTVHNIFTFESVTVVRRRLQHALARAVGTHFVAPSRDVSRNERENWGLTCQVVDNWVADEFSQDSPIDMRAKAVVPLRVAMVGNCSNVKNHEEVLRAVLEVTGVSVVHVGGSSAATDEEQRLVLQLQRESQLEMLGARTDVAAILQGSHIYAMPSLHEGMPVALAEALCVGLPCIISDAPGLRWAAREPGVLVAREASDWVALLQRLSHDDAFMTTTMSAAHAGMKRQRERFSARRGVTDYAAIYSSAHSRR